MEQSSDRHFTMKLVETGNNGLKRKRPTSGCGISKMEKWRIGLSSQSPPESCEFLRSVAIYAERGRGGVRCQNAERNKLASLWRKPVQTCPVGCLISRRHWTNAPLLCPYWCRLQ